MPRCDLYHFSPFDAEEEAEINQLENIANPMLILFDEELEFHPQFDGFDAISKKLPNNLTWNVLTK